MKLDTFLRAKAIQRQSRQIRQEEEFRETKQGAGKEKVEENIAERVTKIVAEIDSPEKNSDYIANEYTQMIRLLNFVFANIPEERCVRREQYRFTDDELSYYATIGAKRFKNVEDNMADDLHKCTLLFCYAILMHIYKQYPSISDTVENLAICFKSFTTNLPRYKYTYTLKDLYDLEEMQLREFYGEQEEVTGSIPVEKETVTSKTKEAHKSHDSKRDLLQNIYNDVFSEKTAYISKEEKYIIEFLLCAEVSFDVTPVLELCTELCIEALIEGNKNIREDNDPRKRAIHHLKFMMDNHPLDSLYKSYHKMQAAYFDHFQKVSQEYEDNPYGEESVFENLTKSEIFAINYLYELFYRYEKKWDLTASENRQRWAKLTNAERAELAKRLNKLYDENGTYLKYIRDEYGKSRADKFYLTLSDLLNNPYYEIIYYANCLLDCCNKISFEKIESNAENYITLKNRIVSAHTLCLNISKEQRHKDDYIKTIDEGMIGKEIEKLAKLLKKIQKSKHCDPQNPTTSSR